MTMMPSRDFMVRQAVLNAIDYWGPFYTKDWLRSWARSHAGLPSKFHEQIITEFHKLVRSFS